MLGESYSWIFPTTYFWSVRHNFWQFLHAYQVGYRRSARFAIDLQACILSMVEHYSYTVNIHTKYHITVSDKLFWYLTLLQWRLTSAMIHSSFLPTKRKTKLFTLVSTRQVTKQWDSSVTLLQCEFQWTHDKLILEWLGTKNSSPTLELRNSSR